MKLYFVKDLNNDNNPVFINSVEYNYRPNNDSVNTVLKYSGSRNLVVLTICRNNHRTDKRRMKGKEPKKHKK